MESPNTCSYYISYSFHLLCTLSLKIWDFTMRLWYYNYNSINHHMFCTKVPTLSLSSL